MAVCGASGFVAHPPMNIANATKAWTGHFIYATYSAARRQHLPCSTCSSFGLTRLWMSSASRSGKSEQGSDHNLARFSGEGSEPSYGRTLFAGIYHTMGTPYRGNSPSSVTTENPRCLAWEMINRSNGSAW